MVKVSHDLFLGWARCLREFTIAVALPSRCNLRADVVVEIAIEMQQQVAGAVSVGVRVRQNCSFESGSTHLWSFAAIFSKSPANSEATVSARSIIRDSRSALRRAAIISIDHTFFHDEEHLFGLADIFRGVAGDGNDVGKFAGIQRADFVLQAEKFGVS